MKQNLKKTKNKFNRKILFLICLLFICLIPFFSTFSRYAINSINEFFNRSKEFYFNSDKLGENNPEFLIDNWSGVDNYTIQVNMNSMKNNILGATYDINYNISYTCSNNAICTLSKTSGTISQETNKDFFLLTVTPNAVLDTGDEVKISISATVQEPYQKTISGSFTLRVGKENIAYVIEDSPSRPYLELKITNTQSYYIVDEAFDSYTVNQKISTDAYLVLSQENKEKCHSALITLTFNPSEVTLDMTNSNYLNAISVRRTTIGSYEYINEISFKVDAISSSTVRFYKNDVSQNYTYPNNNNYSVITFDAR